MKLNLLVAAAVTVLAGAAFAQPASDPSKMDHSKMGHGATGHMAAADKAFMSSMQEMHKDMMAAKGATVDQSFVRKMIAHHEGAVAMAKIELEHGADAEAKKQAQMIIDENTKGIAELRAWLSRHGG